jgi:GNAT superfamily N-acetyltransferase
MNILMKLFMKLFSRNENINKISMRLAVQADFKFIFGLCVKEAQAGHFNPTYAIPMPQIQGGLMRQIACAINDAPYPMEPGNKRNGVGAKILVLMLGDNRVGFVLLLEDLPGSWHSNVELHLFAIANEYRRQGLGACFVNYTLESLKTQKLIYARCYPKSTTMIEILEKEGFVKVRSKGQSVRLELRR